MPYLSIFSTCIDEKWEGEGEYPMKLPTKAAKNNNPAEPALQLYGGSVMISEMVLKETMPAVHPNANCIPARTILGNRKR